MSSPGFGANLARRVGTALVALPLILGLVFHAPNALFVGVVGVIVAAGLVELFALLRAGGIIPMRTIGLLLGAAVFVHVALPAVQRLVLWPAVALVLLVATLTRAGNLTKAVPSAAGTLLGAVYLGGLGGTLAGLRLLEPTAQGSGRVILLLAIIMVSDVAAFFVGHGVGRRRLAPTISPGKTVEGALGGLVGGVLGGIAVQSLGLVPLGLGVSVALGLVVAAAGMGGDLAESLLKRWAGVKDSGALFPGHGGALDRLDSLLFGAPVLYYYFFYLR